MRVKFFAFKNKVLTTEIRNFMYSGFEEGQIICLPDNSAKEYILGKLAEEFNYSITDNEIKQLHKDFNQASDFNKKVDIFISSLTKSVNKAVLEDGNVVEFKLTPNKSDEWLQYNILLTQYYKNEFPDYDLEGLKKVFEKKRFNSPDHYRLIGSELLWIKKTIQADNPKGIKFWYNETIKGNVSKDDAVYNIFLSNPIHFGIDIFLRGKALAEYEAHLKTYKKKMQENECQAYNSIATLSQLFVSATEYNNMMALFVKEKLCQEKTFIWIDEKKGSLKMLASMIKHLHSKGFCRKKPTNAEVQLIAKNTFKMDICLDTIKRAKMDSFDFSFIPEST
jgi:hypothetical protein